MLELLAVPASTADSTLVSTARTVAARIAPMLGGLEDERRLPPPAVAALVEAGVFKLCVPRAYGGAQASPATFADVIEEMAYVDGSLGWCVMIALTSSMMAVYLDEEIAREIYAPGDAITCGVFAPMGRAIAVDGGFRVTGRWPFASGCEHSGWRMGGAIVGTDPSVRCMMFRADETTIHDTWRTSGLRGTGSHDMSVQDVFVPAKRSFSLFTDAPRIAGYELPFFGVLAAGVASVGLGIARAALETAIAMAKTKMQPGGKRPIAQRELVQVEIARSEARVRAARAFLRDSLGDAASDATNVTARAQLRVAACHAATESAAVAAAMYELGGGAAIYTEHPLQRQFRDAHVVTHHLMVSSTALTMAGRVLLGVETDTTML